MSGWISACLNHPCLFEIQFPLNLATASSLTAPGGGAPACAHVPLRSVAAPNCHFVSPRRRRRRSPYAVQGVGGDPRGAQSPGQIGGKRAAMDERLQLVRRRPARQQGDKAQDAMAACLPAVNSTMPLV